MPKKTTQKEIQSNQGIMSTILQNIPKESNVTKIDYEGPKIALYTNSCLLYTS